jgi:hypothetical protein
MSLGITTSIVNDWLKSILVGASNILGRATDMKGGFRYSTRNSLWAVIDNQRWYRSLMPPSAYVWNSVSLTTFSTKFGLDPAMRTFLQGNFFNKQHSTHRLNLPRRCKTSNRVVKPSDTSSGHIFVTDPHSERSIRTIYRWSEPEF